MREIKFRAWDKKEKIMVEPLSITWRCKEIYCVHHAKEHKGGVYLFNGERGTDFELMQYTGLKDKNGKEIYEGDIVENQHGTKGVYVWNDRREGWDVWYKDFPGFETMNEWTVIGDVHDNPELLN